MKKKSLLTTVLLVLGLGAYTVLNTSYSSGFHGGFQSSCGSCHGGSNPATTVTITGLPAFYTPSTAYPISVSVANPNSQNGAGFQFLTNIGTLTTSDSGISIYGTHATHNTKKNGSSPVLFNMTWTAPATGGLVANFNAVGNATRPGGMSQAQWSTASSNVALPANAYNLSAKRNNDQVDISFETESAETIQQFEVERSINGEDFAMITSITPADNGIFSATDYPQNISNTGAFYYRIKEVSMDNRVSYSETVSVNFNSSKKITAYPTIVTNETINIGGLDLKESNALMIFDVVGRKISNTPITETAVRIPELNNGIYFIAVLENNKVLHTQRITIK